MKMLIAVDLSDASRIVMGHARRVAQALRAETWLLHVAEPDPDFVGRGVDPETMRDTVAETFRDQHRELQQLSQEMRSDGLECTSLLIQGPTAEKILSEAARLSVDMIVLGSRGKGAVKRLLVGSASHAVLEKSTVPVLFVPTGGRGSST